MIIRNIKISRRLTLGFVIVLTFSLATSIITFIDINKLWGDTQGLYEHPFLVTNTVREIKINILNMRRYMLDIALTKTNKDIANYEKLLNNEEITAYKNFDILSSAYLGDKKDIETPFKSFKQWKNLRDDAIMLIKQDKKELGTNRILFENRDYVDTLFVQAQKLIDFASNKAVKFYSNSLTTKQTIENSLLIILILSLTFSIILALLITRSITVPLKSIVNNIKEIALGNLSNQKLPDGSDEIGQLSSSFNQMQENLVMKARIAAQIAEGDFSARILSNGSQDVVANAINKIADNFDLVVKQAQTVASGNFEAELVGISKNNQLAIVITQMMDSLREVVAKAKQIAQGDYDGEIMPKSKSDELAMALNQMTISLRDVTLQNSKQNRLKTAQNELSEKMRGDLNPEDLSKNIITFVSKFTNAQIGAIYLRNEELKGYQLTSSYAFTHRKGEHSFFKDGESLVGQAALEKEMITFSQLPNDYVKITSGIGDTIPKNITVVPLVYDSKTLGVMELGSVTEMTDDSYEFLNAVLENIAISIASAQNRYKMVKLLEVTKEQAEELQVQQEELRQTNEELEAQTQSLKKSEEYLQTQQEELRVTNEELEEKTRYLENQKSVMQKQNQELELARVEIEQKAKELEVTNKYKSEFLANMSHELRTPLNSLLILSQTLTENKSKNLTPEQIESAKIIYNSGNDLLNLINDILDLARIESGKIKMAFAPTSVNYFKNNILSYFKHMITEKGIEFEINIQPTLPPKIITDEQRLNQILRNLMSNAIKFTEKGSVTLSIYSPPESENLSRSGLKPSETIAFSVKDTGIGIAKEKQLEIFEAFQQADGSISRKFGGTGLGLSITRELTKLLGGEIKLISEKGKGAEFIIFLPIDSQQKTSQNPIAPKSIIYKDNTSVVQKTQSDTPIIKTIEPLKDEMISSITSIPDDRQHTTPNDKSMLIIEDDSNFAEILASMCRQKSFKCLASATGEEGIELAKQFIPKGIILDINLPGINGWDVLEHLKNTAETRHIPVHVISGYEESIEAYNRGAIGYLTKPVTKERLESTFDELQTFITKKIKDLLIIEDDDNLRKAIKTLLGATDIIISECNTGTGAIDFIKNRDFDCIVLDLGLPDMSGFEILKTLKSNHVKIPPVVVYTGREITPEENEELLKYTQNIIIKGVKSNERLLDETALFLHRVVDNMPEHQKKMLVNLYDRDQMFRDKKVLVVDDDMRNVFALTQVLEASKMKVTMAPNGEKALEILNKDNSMDLVLMDIMMPVMDGYETMERIRKDKRFAKLPIIALTAKAMKEDKEKSIAAGANDYLSKPVDLQKLFNLMRIWLYQ